MTPKTNEKTKATTEAEEISTIPNPNEATLNVGQFSSEATITKIEISTVKEQFGDNALGNPSDTVYVVHFLVSKFEPLDETGKNTFRKIRKLSKNSKLYKFNKRYGQMPTKDFVVKVENDEFGYWQIIV